MSDHSFAGAASRRAPIVMALGGLLVFLAGQIHPRGPLDGDFRTLEGGLLADADTWEWTHAVLAVAIVVLTAGLLLTVRLLRVREDRVLRSATLVALVGLLLSWVEIVFHIAMTSEAHALVTGGPTPLFDTHVVLQAVYTPLFGWGVAAMALRGGLTRRWGNPWIAVLGVVGGVVFGLSGPVVALWPDSHDALLFIGDAPLGLWALASGVAELHPLARWRGRAVAPADSAGASS
ncbi:MAG TPA: hypothetical protein VFJ19_04335 [Nocardioidaceae bacterium]|nr:hypothetical protein [Nocardioidaceae bacterium]